MIELRDYQQQIKSRIYEAWAAGFRAPLATMPTGAGKTVVFSSIAHELQCAVVEIAHRQELVSQMSIALAREDLRHRLIAPPAVQRTIVQLQRELLGGCWLDPNARVAIAGVDTLVSKSRRAALEPWGRTVGVCIQDECFPTGTLVDGRPIESIRVGDTVRAFDESSGALVSRRVSRTFCNPLPDEMMAVGVGSHHSLVCTSGHSFYTRRGWVAAADLTVGEEVLVDAMHTLRGHGCQDERSSEIPISEDGPNLLPTLVRVRAPDRELKAAGAVESPDNDVFYVRVQRGSARASTPPVETNRPSLLQPGVWETISTPYLIENYGEDESQTRIGPYENEQPDAQSRYAGESFGNTQANRAPPKSTGGQWETNTRSRSNVASDVWPAWIRWAVQGINAAQSALPALLQNRLRKRGVQNRNRSGWEQPRDANQSGARQTPRCVLTWRRVGGVSVLKRGDSSFPRGRYVYNLEVEGVHTYLAGGVVVHNCHHVLRENKWGRAIDLFPNAKILGVTATAGRADGKGLGAHADGIFDTMIEGPGMRDLINEGHLCDYEIYAPLTEINLEGVAIGSTGDYSPKQLARAVHRSRLVGDVVKHYLRLAPGKLGLTFAVDVEAAGEYAAAFCQHGVPAAVITANTGDRERYELLRRFERREILQIVNVDIFGEGVDCRQLEVVSFARPTKSENLYCQQFGRVLRPAPGKRAIVIDHVDNVREHNGPPDFPRIWSLERRPKRQADRDPDAIPVRVCVNCTQPYESYRDRCPHCSHAHSPSRRDGPQYVEGDLEQLDPAALDAMRQQLAEADLDPAMVRARVMQKGGPIVGGHRAAQLQRARQAAQAPLRQALGMFGGLLAAAGYSEAEQRRKFYQRYRIDVASAQVLGRKEAHVLAARLLHDFGRGAIG